MPLQDNLEKIVRKLGVPPEKARDTVGVAAITGSFIAAVATGCERNPDTFVQGMQFIFELVAFGYGGIQIEKGTYLSHANTTQAPDSAIATETLAG